ncbi:hypothetical protein PIB30_001529 [Stylosanthes scabra]|uniref:Reverse transcriptase domain-containing protein n=1 Tax=Stylosanthes scabra TaxID=79078 RepID=A0ABU6R379_9FABA|nr:hypothetical protein [Stylosanthes scabra]
MAAKQQALLEEAEKRDQELKEKLRNRLTYSDDDEVVADSRSRTWKPSIVAGSPPARENNKHPFSLAILSEELPKKFKYPTDMEPYDGSSDPKHHLEAFDNRMVLLNASDATKCKAFSVTFKKGHADMVQFSSPRKYQELLRPVWRFSKKLHHSEKEEGQSAVKTDRVKKEIGRKDLSREDRSRREQRSGRSYYNPLNVSLTTFLHEVSQVERIPAPREIKNNNRGDRNAYCKYHKQNDHDTEDCRDLLEFVEKGLKKEKFQEYTGRSSDRRDDRRTRHRVDSPEKSTEGKKAIKRSLPRKLCDILFRRCFDALGLTDEDLESHFDELVGFSGERVTPDGFVTLWITVGDPPHSRNTKTVDGLAYYAETNKRQRSAITPPCTFKGTTSKARKTGGSKRMSPSRPRTTS